MALLKRVLCILWFASQSVSYTHADAEFLTSFDFSGFIQSRLTTLLFNTNTPAGPLNDLPNPDRAGGEAFTQALIKRLEFKLSTRLPWHGWSLKTNTSVGGSQTTFKDLYLAYQPTPEWTIILGQFPVPFGADPQVAADVMDLVERPIIYGFGNFGWVAPLGMHFIGERDYGLRTDWCAQPGFANFAPQLQLGLVGGNGQGVRAKSIAQALARMAIVNEINWVEVKNDFSLGVSLSYGANHFIEPSENYIPIGATNDLNLRPDLALAAEPLGERGVVKVFGLDATSRMDKFVIKGEAVTRQLGKYSAQGYYVTALLEEIDWGIPLTLALRWDEAMQGYADGCHSPHVWYQAYTVGLTWHPNSHWRVQANYISLLLDKQQHVFPGSDLFIMQIQLNF